MPEVFDANKDKPTTPEFVPSDTAPVTDPPLAESSSVDSEALLNRTRPLVEPGADPWAGVDAFSSVLRNEQPSHNPLDAFAPKPLTVHGFDSQMEDERILLLLRQHPITQVPKVFVAIFMLLFPLVFHFADFWEALPGRFQTAILLFWYLLIAAYILQAFLSWFYNAYIVTNERVIDIDFLSLIYKNISAAELDRIEDVTATTGGAIRSIFNFGTVGVQTAAAIPQFEFEDVPQPNKVTQFLDEMIHEEERVRVQGRVNI